MEEIKKGKVSTFQFFSMLYLTRTLITLTFTPAYFKDIGLTDTVIQPIFRLVFGIITVIPAYLIYKKNSEENVMDILRKRSPLLSKIAALIYAFAFFYFLITTVTRLDVFAGTIVFPETEVNYLIIFIIIIGCYGAYLGFESLCRSAVLSLALVVPALVIILATLVKKIDFLNYTSAFYYGFSPVVKAGLNAVGRSVEYSIIAVALPRVNGNVKKGFIGWISAHVITTVVYFFFAVGVMGNYMKNQLFPMHTLASLAQFSLFERMDVLITGAWILCAFLKISFLLYLITDILRKEFKEESKVKILLPVGVLASVVSLYIAGAIERFFAFDNSKILIAITAVTSVIIPIIALLLSKREGDKKCKKQSQ